jgi:hypothetical protein
LAGAGGCLTPRGGGGGGGADPVSVFHLLP